MSVAIRTLVLTAKGKRALLLDALGISLPPSYAVRWADECPRGHVLKRSGCCSQCTKNDMRKRRAA